MACIYPSESQNIFTIPINKNFPSSFIPVIGNLPFFHNVNYRFRAHNSGKLTIKCLINGICPFSKYAKLENTLVFNRAVMSKYPDTLRDKIDIDDNGISLKPLYVYRHNFLSTYNQSDDLLVPAGVNPAYRRAFTFTPEPSFYYKAGTDKGCNNDPSFTYGSKEVTNALSADDLVNDGTPLSYNNIQYILQGNAQQCSRLGTHWRLTKNLSLFHGQDFFIHFVKEAEPNRGRAAEDNSSVPFSQYAKDYSFLDASLDTALPSNQKIVPGFKKPIPINNAVTRYDNESYAKDVKFNQYSLIDQQYIIVELGRNKRDSHYFIIITERGNPLFVENRGGVSIAHSRYGAVTGGQLFSSDFILSVRNIGGLIAIDFKKSDGSLLPRWDIRAENKTTSSEGNIIPESTPTRVPAGWMSIWGGNSKIGILFECIQYPETTRMDLPFSKYFQGLVYTNDQSESQGAYSVPNHPSYKLTFSSTDADVTGIVFPSGSPKSDIKRQVYTSGANRYIEYSGINEAIYGSQRSGSVITFNSPGFFNEPYYTDNSGIIKSTLSVQPINNKVDLSSRNMTFDIRVTMSSGSHTFLGDATVWTLNRCVSPFMNIIRIISYDPQEPMRWETKCVDVSHHVLSLNDMWSAQDFTSIEHSANISFWINDGTKFKDGTVNYSSFLRSLKNKAFYIELWAGYDGCNYSRLGQKLYKIFTGICNSGGYKISAGQTIMDCQIDDFSKILKDQRMFNSPFFDGVVDAYVINEVLAQAGFRGQSTRASMNSSSSGSRESLSNNPRTILQDMIDSKDFNANSLYAGVDNTGRRFYAWPWALPSSYDRYQSPMHKYDDGKPYYDIIMDVAKKAAKVFYFDQYGVARYDNKLDAVIKYISSGDEGNTQVPFEFTTNPVYYPGQLVFMDYNVQHDVESVFNHLKVLSSTPNHELLIYDDVDWNTYDNLTSEGFLGYFRTFFQKESYFGSEKALRNIMAYYRTMFRPPLNVKFQTYGLPVRALDVVKLNGQMVRVMRVNSTFDPKENRWWQEYEGEWLQKARPIVNA